MSIEGCAHLLHTKKPVGLHGVMVSGVEDSGKGWIQLTLGTDSDSVSIEIQNGKVVMSFTSEIALSIAGLILCLIEQNNAFRVQNDLEALKRNSIEIEGNYTKTSIEISFALNESYVTAEELKSDQQIEIRIFDDIAACIADSLFNLLGIQFASIANAMLEDI